MVAGYEVQAVKRKTVVMESAERDVAATEAAERGAVGNEV